MNGSEPVACQALAVLVLIIAGGPWMTLSGLRVLQDSSRIGQEPLINWLVTHSALATGNIRFWAWMVFLVGVGMDLIGILMLVAIVGAVLSS